MPAPISFAWTTPALVAGHKTCTRGEWSPIHAARYAEGDEVTAYDKQPRFGGRPVARIRLTADPELQNTRDAADEDYEAEGFPYLEEIGAKVDGLKPSVLWKAWKLHPQEMWVVRFEVIELLHPEDRA